MTAESSKSIMNLKLQCCPPSFQVKNAQVHHSSAQSRRGFRILGWYQLRRHYMDECGSPRCHLKLPSILGRITVNSVVPIVARCISIRLILRSNAGYGRIFWMYSIWPVFCLLRIFIQTLYEAHRASPYITDFQQRSSFSVRSRL